MSSQAELLSELCGICYTETPKYRCPRCSARTCSLACYKRHQQRASCNGKRDPAAYRKKSQLATPAGIDQDYNYLKSVEREIDVAHRDTHERGIGHGTASKTFSRGLNRDGPVQQYLITNRIHVTRAPQGMSRQRTNQTRCTKNKRIMWTVEWIDADDKRDLQDNSLATDTIHGLYQALQTEKHNSAKRKQANESDAPTSNPKRQRGSEALQNATASEGDVGNPPEQAQDDTNTDHIAGDQPHPDAETKAGATNSAPDSKQDRDPAHEQAPEPYNTTHFYLLRPNTASGQKVLIPVDPSLTLTAALTGRTVLEYPTIYALPFPPDHLPSTFITQEQYFAMRKQEDKELTDAITKTGTARPQASLRPDAHAQEAERKAAALNDPQRILDMLRRDLSAAR